MGEMADRASLIIRGRLVASEAEHPQVTMWVRSGPRQLAYPVHARLYREEVVIDEVISGRTPSGRVTLYHYKAPSSIFRERKTSTALQRIWFLKDATPSGVFRPVCDLEMASVELPDFPRTRMLAAVPALPGRTSSAPPVDVRSRLARGLLNPMNIVDWPSFAPTRQQWRYHAVSLVGVERERQLEQALPYAADPPPPRGRARRSIFRPGTGAGQ